MLINLEGNQPLTSKVYEPFVPMYDVHHTPNSGRHEIKVVLVSLFFAFLVKNLVPYYECHSRTLHASLFPFCFLGFPVLHSFRVCQIRHLCQNCLMTSTTTCHVCFQTGSNSWIRIIYVYCCQGDASRKVLHDRSLRDVRESAPSSVLTKKLLRGKMRWLSPRNWNLSF